MGRKKDDPKLVRRNAKIHTRYDELYNGKKFRSDYVVQLLAEEFYLGESTVLRLLQNTNKDGTPRNDNS